MQVFDLQSKISLDSSDFFSGLRKSERGMKDFGDKMAMGFDKLKSAAKWLVTGVAIKKGVDAAKSLATETAHAGDRIDKQSQALGVSRKAFQEWDYILSQSGASIDSLGVSMRTLSSAILDGSNETDEALKTIGLSVDSLKGLTEEQAFERVVRAFQTLPAGMNKSAAAVKLFGRNGRELLPLLNSDIYTIDILRAKAQDLGLVMSDDAVNASVAYTDALDTLQRTFAGLRYSIGAKILPVLTNAFTKITNYAGKIRRVYEAEGLSGVFKTVVADIRNIKWPSWDDVRKAATRAWDDIKKGVADFGGLVFGKNKDGEVNWPSVADALSYAGKLWGWIVDGVADLGGLIFGRDKDGEVNWPTLKDIIEYADNLWGELVDAVVDFAGLVFGKNKDGEVNWPAFSDLVLFAEGLWTDLIAFVGDLGGMIFGKNKDGTVKWPTLKDLTDAADKLWEEVVEYVGKLGGLIFGDSEGSIAVFQGIADAIGAIGAAVLAYGFVDKLTQTVANIQKLFTFDTTNGGLNKTGIILAAIAAAFTLIAENWDDIKPVLDNAIQWMDTNFFKPINGFIQDFIIGPVQKIIDKVNEALVALGILPKELSRAEAIERGKFAFEHFMDTGEYVTFEDFIQKRFGGTEEGKKIDELNKSVLAASLNRRKPELAKTMGYPVLTDEEFKELLNDFYEMLGRATSNAEEAKTAVEEVGEAADNAAGERNINFDVTTSGEEELLSTGRITRDKSTQTREINMPEVETEYETSGRGHGGSFAKGLWDVPYNDFPALLHEGEMVLTKTQANEYRDGGGSGTSSRMIVSAIQKLENTMANLRLMVGEKEFGRATTEYGGRRMNNYIGGVDNRLAAGYGS